MADLEQRVAELEERLEKAQKLNALHSEIRRLNTQSRELTELHDKLWQKWFGPIDQYQLQHWVNEMKKEVE